ncbi:MAG: hypothetical protein GC146_09180 [Limimaricola sp.]|uniref:hypothetical protein n=1 Tax=Limimaricola sp. TaxID=2211665 RepID=UPI001DB465C9|nr:hypothetical protein [Limimaricola sp.]MBI1417382.1 hypothetical protein [Limimaricola sp.]
MPPVSPSSAPDGGAGSGPGLTEVAAVALGIAWLVAASVIFIVMPGTSSTTAVDGADPLRFVMVLLAVFLPVAMIWVAAAAARSGRIMREESRRLQVAIDAIRKAYIADRQARGAVAPPTTVERKLDEIAQAARQTESTLAVFASSRPAASRAVIRPGTPEPAEEEPRLALGTSSEEMQPPLARSDLIRALNFPDTDTDEVGFAALRRALKDRPARQLIQASQDVLTLLSQDGIYMDDLRPDRARPEIWRRFAAGERGRAVAALGGVRDRTSLALAIGRMREDAIFRDAAHHFLRRFDQMLVAFEPEASDEDLVDLSETRTARAFMLLGRVTGAFD